MDNAFGKRPLSEGEKAAFRSDPATQRAMRAEIKTWMDQYAKAVIDERSADMKAMEDECLDNLGNNVRDPALREKLRRDYRAGCKRLV